MPRRTAGRPLPLPAVTAPCSRPRTSLPQSHTLHTATRGRKRGLYHCHSFTQRPSGALSKPSRCKAFLTELTVQSPLRKSGTAGTRNGGYDRSKCRRQRRGLCARLAPAQASCRPLTEGREELVKNHPWTPARWSMGAKNMRRQSGHVQSLHLAPEALGAADRVLNRVSSCSPF